ncbi:magnesium chelatase subunit D [Kushneria sinocarnis]|uniref:Magnesium chelatase subunit D n=1 Tax=Kushneria sinocarnis TaxID=595502 RepID=A0A420WYF7_9GAMM|nr:AAA family ATPase [Kushneria sinocarnis]RKR06264.1 magnesium chelatase subunit D [Kushneria sinocarnis]
MFPFTAVVGHDRLKTALILATLDPRLGGVLISGPRGTAKSTLARGLAELLPEQDARLVTLPLGTSEEQLIGTLDLEQALGNGSLAFQPGLLHRAHHGALYIDEVNLLPDTLVDQLLDVAASGINRIERDGISHEHPADFLLIGTMNPEEGELRPQLTDRFGLFMMLDDTFDAEQRMTIVERRLAYDRNPDAFRAEWQPRQQALRTRLDEARSRLPTVQLPAMLAREIAERCMQAGVEGVRADLCWQRAALAHAAWQQRSMVEQSDLDAVQALVLDHRRTRPPESSASNPPDEGSSTHSAGGAPERQRPTVERPDLDQQQSRNTDASGADHPQEHQAQAPSQGDDSGHAGDHGRLEAPATPTRVAMAEIQWPSAPRRTAPHHAGKPPAADRHGAHAGPSATRHGVETPRCSSFDRPRIHWPRTLMSAVRRQRPLSESLHHHPPRTNSSTLQCLLVDTSASGIDAHGATPIIAVLQSLLERAYRSRHEVMVLGFGGNGCHWLLEPQRAPRNPSPLLSRLHFGGGTPLREALATAQQRLARMAQRSPARHLQSWLITDGRSRDTIDALAWPGQLTVLDTEQARVPLGHCRHIAATLKAEYITTRALSAGSATNAFIPSSERHP